MLIPSKFSGYSEGGRVTSVRRCNISSDNSPPAATTQTTELPEWAKPYAKQVLGMGQQLLPAEYDEAGNKISGTEYQQYGGERVAQFSPLQRQAFQGAQTMQPSALGGYGGDVAASAATQALGSYYDPYRTGQFNRQAGQYMSPYMQNVVEGQQRGAIRASEVQRASDQANAVRSGAFGGSRQAIVEAERQRALGTQLGDIQAKGLQSAYDQAQQQFNTEQQLREQSRQYGAGYGMQGLQTALQGAGQLGTLGQQQFQQGMDINKLQQAYGTQQQQQVQNILTNQYQDFLNQQRYPYQQLEFMSNLIRGTPSGTVSTMYNPAPSAISQLAGLGTAAYGLGALGGGATGAAAGKAEGGTVSSYADGGETDSNSPTTSAGLADLAIRNMF